VIHTQFVYLKESFCPSLDEKISVLYEVLLIGLLKFYLTFVGVVSGSS
jgi:hypothetical protein